jgi:hypothetical protein
VLFSCAWRVAPCVELLHCRLASCTPHTPRCNVEHPVENKHDGLLGRHPGVAWDRVQSRLRGLEIVGARRRLRGELELIVAA